MVFSCNRLQWRRRRQGIVGGGCETKSKHEISTESTESQVGKGKPTKKPTQVRWDVGDQTRDKLTWLAEAFRALSCVVSLRLVENRAPETSWFFNELDICSSMLSRTSGLSGTCMKKLAWRTCTLHDFEIASTTGNGRDETGTTPESIWSRFSRPSWQQKALMRTTRKNAFALISRRPRCRSLLMKYSSAFPGNRFNGRTGCLV